MLHIFLLLIFSLSNPSHAAVVNCPTNSLIDAVNAIGQKHVSELVDILLDGTPTKIELPEDQLAALMVARFRVREALLRRGDKDHLKKTGNYQETLRLINQVITTELQSRLQTGLSTESGQNTANIVRAAGEQLRTVSWHSISVLHAFLDFHHLPYPAEKF